MTKRVKFSDVVKFETKATAINVENIVKEAEIKNIKDMADDIESDSKYSPEELSGGVSITDLIDNILTGGNKKQEKISTTGGKKDKNEDKNEEEEIWIDDDDSDDISSNSEPEESEDDSTEIEESSETSKKKTKTKKSYKEIINELKSEYTDKIVFTGGNKKPIERGTLMLSYPYCLKSK